MRNVDYSNSSQQATPFFSAGLWRDGITDPEGAPQDTRQPRRLPRPPQASLHLLGRAEELSGQGTGNGHDEIRTGGYLLEFLNRPRARGGQMVERRRRGVQSRSPFREGGVVVARRWLLRARELYLSIYLSVCLTIHRIGMSERCFEGKDDSQVQNHWRAARATASSEREINFFGNGNGGKKVAKLSQKL